MRYLQMFFFLVVLAGCSKGPGEGGRATIKGTVLTEWRLVTSNPNTFQFESIAADHEVYIIYGEEIAVGDRVRTNYKGEFEFKGLREGAYTIYTYSEDTTGNTGIDASRMPILINTSIGDRKQELTLDPIVRYEKP